jgi:purine-binding chemotaxis protein CheW
MIEPSAWPADWVVFRLQEREYALPVNVVVEVLPMVALIPVPDAPSALAGLLNLRGAIVPTLDVRTLLGLPGRRPDLHTPILVAHGGCRRVGLIVDEVAEVKTLPLLAISPADPLTGPATPLMGVVCQDGRSVLLLDIEILLAKERCYEA